MNKNDVEHIRTAIDNGDLLHACEWLKKKYDEDWRGYLRERFSNPVYSPGELHKKIVSLDSRAVFSLNFDNIYESAANTDGANAYHVKHYYQSDVCEFLRGDGRYIVKIHGGIESPDNLIFTQKDYSEARIKYSAFYTAFDAALLTHTFVFIGCGYSDPDLNLLLENQAFGFPGNSASPHYFVSSDQMSADLKCSLRQNRNLKTLVYDKVDDAHSGLLREIENLVEQVEDRRRNLTENINW